jgi:hypothetical protein
VSDIYVCRGRLVANVNSVNGRISSTTTWARPRRKKRSKCGRVLRIEMGALVLLLLSIPPVLYIDLYEIEL